MNLKTNSDVEAFIIEMGAKIEEFWAIISKQTNNGESFPIDTEVSHENQRKIFGLMGVMRPLVFNPSTSPILMSKEFLKEKALMTPPVYEGLSQVKSEVTETKITEEYIYNQIKDFAPNSPVWSNFYNKYGISRIVKKPETFARKIYEAIIEGNKDDDPIADASISNESEHISEQGNEEKN